jgi:uncharacterized protein (DUF488 family)
MTILTIGHSNHPLDVFRDLLRRHAVAVLADVRSSPYSRYATQFNRDSLSAYVKGEGIEYRYFGDALGGRPPQDEFYDDSGHVLYDRLAESREFQQGIDRLIRVAGDRRVAVLCSEEDPTDCHRRRLIGRVLQERGLEVIHLRADGRVQTEEELGREERHRKTGGQLALFDLG